METYSIENPHVGANGTGQMQQAMDEISPQYVERAKRIIDLRNGLSDCAVSARTIRSTGISTGKQPFYCITTNGIIHGSAQKGHAEFRKSAMGRGGSIDNPISHGNIDATMQTILRLCVNSARADEIAETTERLTRERTAAVKAYLASVTQSVENWLRSPLTALLCSGYQMAPVEVEENTLDTEFEAFFFGKYGRPLAALIENVRGLCRDLHDYRTWHDNSQKPGSEEASVRNEDRW